MTYWLVARTEIPLNPSSSGQAFLSADCLRETEAEALTCCPEPVTKRRGSDEWAELEVVASTETDDDFYGPFVETWASSRMTTPGRCSIQRGRTRHRTASR